ncbi:MAG: hypothetical protein HQM08_25375 [Candidatus Riflebacteria bacterium]|nr:hypothetical protein [Candidatus Riflebacteria bacterium]
MIGFGLFLSGCAADSGSIAVQRIGPSDVKPEEVTYFFDGRGYINGTFFPLSEGLVSEYPISYIGSWTPVANESEARFGYISIHSETPGDSVQIVGTYSRVIFMFCDYQALTDTGVVNFSQDGQDLGNFNLNSVGANGEKILQYVITTGKMTATTITMKIVKPPVVLNGYTLILYALSVLPE